MSFCVRYRRECDATVASVGFSISQYASVSGFFSSSRVSCETRALPYVPNYRPNIRIQRNTAAASGACLSKQFTKCKLKKRKSQFTKSVTMAALQNKSKHHKSENEKDDDDHDNDDHDNDEQESEDHNHDDHDVVSMILSRRSAQDGTRDDEYLVQWQIERNDVLYNNGRTWEKRSSLAKDNNDMFRAFDSASRVTLDKGDYSFDDLVQCYSNGLDSNEKVAMAKLERRMGRDDDDKEDKCPIDRQVSYCIESLSRSQIRKICSHRTPSSTGPS